MALAPDGGSAPYTSPSAVIALIERFRDHGLQTPFTLDVLTRAGIKEGLAARTLQSLKHLDLIDEAGEPTPHLRGLQREGSETYKERVAEWIRAVYAPIFSFVNPATAEAQRVRDAFRSYSPHGQQARMVTLFLGLCEYAGIIEGRPKAVPTPRIRQVATSRQTTGQRIAQRLRAGGRDESVPSSPQKAAATAIPETLVALMREGLPAQGESWTADRKAGFLHIFEVLLDFSFPVVSEAKTSPDDGEVMP